MIRNQSRSELSFSWNRSWRRSPALSAQDAPWMPEPRLLRVISGQSGRPDAAPARVRTDDLDGWLLPVARAPEPGSRAGCIRPPFADGVSHAVRAWSALTGGAARIGRYSCRQCASDQDRPARSDADREGRPAFPALWSQRCSSGEIGAIYALPSMRYQAPARWHRAADT